MCAMPGLPGVPGAVLHAHRLHYVPVGCQLRTRGAEPLHIRQLAGRAPGATEVGQNMLVLCMLFGTGLGHVAAGHGHRQLTGMDLYASHFSMRRMPLLQREGSHAAPEPAGSHGAAPPVTAPGGRNAADHPGPAGLPAAGSVLPLSCTVARPSLCVFCSRVVTFEHCSPLVTLCTQSDRQAAVQATTDSMVAARSGAVLGAHTILKVLLALRPNNAARICSHGRPCHNRETVMQLDQWLSSYRKIVLYALMVKV